MGDNVYLEIFGYIGTALVIISMMMTSITKLRIFNITGSIISTIYSVIYNTWPIVVMNSCLIIINTFHLIRSFCHKKIYHCVKIENNDKIIDLFINKNNKDLSCYYNKIDYKSNDLTFVIYDGCEAIALISGNKNNNIFEIKYIYSNKGNRNSNVFSQLFNELKENNVNVLSSSLVSEKQVKFLLNLKFEFKGELLIKEI